MTSELVTVRHLGRKAVIYIRQSTPQQVLSNQESLRLQYALRQRAQDLGWHEADIEVIDTDLGHSGVTAAQREGGVVQNLPFPGYTGVQKAPACEGRIATGRVSCAGGCAPPRGQACWG